MTYTHNSIDLQMPHVAWQKSRMTGREQPPLRYTT